MSKPMIRIHNLETDEIIDREMTESEYADYLAVQAAQVESDTAIAQAAAAKEAAQAKLAALGLTADDLKALGLGNN
jgi:hypothetical protein